LSIDASLSKTKICTPDYAALSVKDGIVDRARRLTGRRPDIDNKNPEIRLHLHINIKQAEISLDLSGEGLHKRGYRIETVKAGLRENTAAAMLIRAGWPCQTDKPFIFIDPMCGSGTILTEAAMISADIAPALNRKRFGFEKWTGHKKDLFSKLKKEAEKRAESGIQKLEDLKLPLFSGSDINPKAVTTARSNIRVSAVGKLFNSGIIRINKADFFREASFPENIETTDKFLAVNPPYGERLNRDDDMIEFYSRIGRTLKQNYAGFKICLLTGSKELSDATGLKADKINTIYNGGIRCTLAHYKIFENRNTKEIEQPKTAYSYPDFEELSPGAKMMYNRLKKNAKNLKKWLSKTGIECYRLYDADMPEYSVAVDIYPPEVVIQEYRAPASIDKVAAAKRFSDAVMAVQAWLKLPEDRLKIKKRQKQHGKNQYEKSNEKNDKRIIKENGLKFFIDTTTYLDTGIFLDSRPIRSLIKNEAKGKRFLNLFSYTATASVYAAAGDAVSTTSVDASKTYLDWAKLNLKLNGFADGDHSFVKSDCINWLKTAPGTWDLIFLDPPTFSNSKDRREIFDLQKDHENLIRLTMNKLSPDGLLLFCNNFRKFKISENLLKDFAIKEITDDTLDPDFSRKTIHRCWSIKKEL
ncbi:MAG: bifunctional 23S rRNA (guanine(2069)-N(7))-methyltransferase RlmK/23S rRNA (guanine(2445)-N(2))-methyltransferase RlmL, partial [Spirochaetales bacterium]|nr:bifunctional 23S rRNA (guanine(2069)-N(7))-methyltransferase RlmK/23S rRNA (guanine(2445)-N(2))-methyltransferase RlmL [Spirochaetales bacterium]